MPINILRIVMSAVLTNSPTPTGVPQFNSILTLTTQSQNPIPQVKRQVPHQTALTSGTSCPWDSEDTPTSVPLDYEFEGPHDSYLMFDDLLELRKALTLEHHGLERKGPFIRRCFSIDNLKKLESKPCSLK